MRFLVDANLSPVVAARLRDGGHDAVHVADLGLLTASDHEILTRADDDERVVLSADSDFGTWLAVGRLSKPSLVLLRSADHLAPLQQADLVLAHLPLVREDLTAGASVTVAHPARALRARGGRRLTAISPRHDLNSDVPRSTMGASGPMIDMPTSRRAPPVVEPKCRAGTLAR